MSIFANGLNSGAPLYVAPRNENKNDTTLRHEFDALGYPVPYFRMTNADNMMKNMGVTDRALRFFTIKRACDAIARDNPHRAMEDLAKAVDVTGVYIILSCLLTGTRN